MSRVVVSLNPLKFGEHCNGENWAKEGTVGCQVGPVDLRSLRKGNQEGPFKIALRIDIGVSDEQL